MFGVLSIGLWFAGQLSIPLSGGSAGQRMILLSLLALMENSVSQDALPTLPSPDRASQTGEDALNSWTRLSLDEPLHIQVKSIGERLHLDCSITGSPVPMYTWFKNGRKIDESSRRVTLKNTEWGNRLRINTLEIEDEGVYTCVGTNIRGSVNTSAMVTVAPVPTTRRPFSFTRLPSESQPRPEGSDDISDDDVIQPFCQDYKGTYCSFLRTHDIYVTSRSDQLQGENDVIEMVRRFTLIDVPAGSQCFQKSVEAMCYFKMPPCGSVMRTGHATAKRLCRDECEALFPICKSALDNDVTNWRLLPDCSKLNNELGCIRIGLTPDNSKQVVVPPPEEDMSSLLLQVVLPVVLGILIVVAIVIIVVCICRRRKLNSNPPKSPASSVGRLSSSGKAIELASVSDKSSVYMKDVPADNIHYIQELGSGSFGKVFKGQVFGLYGNGTASMVFVKSLVEKPTAQQQQEFHEEVSSMTEIRHQHVISLLGVSTKGVLHCILYEYLPLGDLRQFLLGQEGRSHTLEHKELMYIVTQVASGLEYLTSKDYVHKDIAARNIIVSHNLNVKISNLKINYGLYSVDYHHIHHQLIPIRWTPPETITYGKFSHDTDVYSFGVFMWEVFSGGEQPYPGYSNQEVIDMVRSRQLLPCPSDCPPRLYSLMMECWHEKSSQRPVAREVHQKLRAWYLDKSNVYALSNNSGQSAPSVATSSVPSHHSSTGPSNPSNQTNITEIRSNGDTMSTQPLPKPTFKVQAALDQQAFKQPSLDQSPYKQSSLEQPPYYNVLYPEHLDQGPTECEETSSSFSESTINDDDESEFVMPMPNQRATLNQYTCSSLSKRPRDHPCEQRIQTQVNYDQDLV